MEKFLLHSTIVKCIKLGGLALLVIYTLVHYLQTGIFFAAKPTSIGDFATTWPTYWAWAINPDLIKQNHIVEIWMGSAGANKWNYGPVVHFVLFPLLLGIKSYHCAILIWLFTCHVLLLITMFLWYKILFINTKLHSSATAILYCFLWLNFFPLYECLVSKNVEILELFFVTLSFFLLFKKREVSSGIFLALAVMTKFLPFIFLPYFMIKKKYKLTISSLITILIIALFSQYFLGWENNVTLSMIRGVGGTWSSYESQAMSSWIYRLFSMPSVNYEAVLSINTNLIIFLTRIVIYSFILFYGIMILCLNRHAIVASEIAILMILMITLMQHAHVYYLIFLLVPFSFFLQNIVILLQDNYFNLRLKLELGILLSSYAILGVILPFRFLTFLFNHALEVYLYYSFPVYGYLALLVYFTFENLNQRSQLFY